MESREQLIDMYADYILEGMSNKELYMYAYERVCDNLKDFSDDELLDEIRQFAPYIIEEISDDA